ncbi:hypothetical protein [Ferrimonas pelagia]|uniref:Lipoprotein n=1 Tax=Ferrimonas pelagia TaxID=1177826 RepID=A0ABP9ED19_9GAMM
MKYWPALALLVVLTGCSSEDPASTFEPGAQLEHLQIAQESVQIRRFASAQDSYAVYYRYPSQQASGSWQDWDNRSASIGVETSLLDSPVAASQPALYSELPVGELQLLLNDQRLSLSRDSDGQLRSDGNGCQLSGERLAEFVAGADQISLTLQQCGELDGHYQGVLFADPTLAPAAADLIVSNSDTVLDLLLYR